MYMYPIYATHTSCSLSLPVCLFFLYNSLRLLLCLRLCFPSITDNLSALPVYSFLLLLLLLRIFSPYNPPVLLCQTARSTIAVIYICPVTVIYRRVVLCPVCPCASVSLRSCRSCVPPPVCLVVVVPDRCHTYLQPPV